MEYRICERHEFEAWSRFLYEQLYVWNKVGYILAVEHCMDE